MSSFQEFMDDAKKSPDTALLASNMSLSMIQTSLVSTVGNLLSPFFVPSDKKQKFAEEVSNLAQDEEFISEFSNRIGLPSETETEDEFVERSRDVLRRMLYDQFGIKD